MEKFWAELDEEICPCKGSGWRELADNLYQECPIHYAGQMLPPDRLEFIGDPKRLAEEERKSILKWQINNIALAIQKQENILLSLKSKYKLLQSELINKTPTLRMSSVVQETSPSSLRSTQRSVKYQDR